MQRLGQYPLMIGLPVVLILLYSWDWPARPTSGCGVACPSDSAVVIGGSATAAAQETQPRYTNLQVLPEHISKDELKKVMKLISKSLGAKCNFCHRTDTKDYASDEIREKVIARNMMRMVEHINRELFTWKDAPPSTCYMCHRGQRKPQMHPPDVEVAMEQQ